MNSLHLHACIKAAVHYKIAVRFTHLKERLDHLKVCSIWIYITQSMSFIHIIPATSLHMVAIWCLFSSSLAYDLSVTLFLMHQFLLFNEFMRYSDERKNRKKPRIAQNNNLHTNKHIKRQTLSEKKRICSATAST